MKLVVFLTITFYTLVVFPSFCIAQEKDKKNTSQEAFQHDPGDDANTHMHKHSIESMVQAFDSDERDEWQKPDEVVALMGNLNGKTVMDIGSGSGYFSFRLADAGATVICADVDDRFLDVIKEKKATDGYTDDQIQLRKVPYDSPKLKENEVDKVIIVNTYHHVEDREAYFAKVKTGLKQAGKLYVIDFLKEELDFGPPISMKLDEKQVMSELFDAGFRKFEVNIDLLPYQYIIIAE